MKTIALVDTNHGRGHHLTYMRFLSKTLLEMGYRVMVFYPSPNEVKRWIAFHCSEHLERFFSFEMQELKYKDIPVLRNFPFHRFPQPAAVLARWRQATTGIQNASRQTGYSPDLVFFNWLDNYFSYYLSHHIIDRIFPYKWSGIYFRPGDLRFRKRFPFPHYAIAQSSQCQALTVLDEGVAQKLQQKLKSPVISFPDLTDETPPNLNLEIVKKIRAKAGHRKIIGLMGSLSKRKGLLTLLEVSQKVVDKDWFFVFAGPLPPETFHQEYNQKLTEDYQKVQDIVRLAPSNCFFYFEHIADGSQFNAFINMCDVLFAAYENFPYSSNILTKAAVFKKPLIVSEGFCMAKRVEKFQMGVTIPEGDVSKCIEALKFLFSSPIKKRQIRFNFEGYRSLHSTEYLKKIFHMTLGNAESGLDKNQSQIVAINS